MRETGHKSWHERSERVGDSQQVFQPKGAQVGGGHGSSLEPRPRLQACPPSCALDSAGLLPAWADPTHLTMHKCPCRSSASSG